MGELGPGEITSISYEFSGEEGELDNAFEEVLEATEDVFSKPSVDGKSLSMSEAFELGTLFKNVQYTEDDDPQRPLSVISSIESILQLSDFSSRIEPHLEEERRELDEKITQEESLTEEEQETLIQKSKFWEQTIKDELGDEKRLAISSRGLFNVEKAMEQPRELFDESVWKWLPDLPKNDISEACRCLAIESSTAATILSLRAVEECLRQWYGEITEETSLEQVPWGGVLDQIENEFNERERDPAVLVNLDYLRIKRNEVNHPDKSPSWSEAEATLYIVRNTITEIHSEISEEGSTDVETDTGE